MANKHTKRYSTSYVIREMQIRTMRYHYIPIRMAKIQKNNTTKYWWGHGATRILLHCWWECKMVQPLQKTVWWFLTKLNILYPYDPAIALFSTYPRELKTFVHTKNLHIDVHSSVIHNCQNLEAINMPFRRWMDNLCYIHTMNIIQR